MSLKPYLHQRLKGQPLCDKEAEAAFSFLLKQDTDPALAAAFLTALYNNETVVEITAAAKVMRAHAHKLSAPEGATDTCGTGGDMAGTYNISTACAFIVAGAGVPVAKHGNRAASSQSGSADVLESLGINISLPPAKAQAALTQCGITFLFAQTHHPALRHLAPMRKALGFPTIFNMLGPLANPAGVTRQLIGVGHAHWLKPMAEALRNLGCTHAWLVHSGDGMDELSLKAPSTIIDVHNGQLTERIISPSDYDIPPQTIEAIQGATAQDNAQALTHVLDGKPSAYRDIALFNSAAALVIAGQCQDIAQGLSIAKESLDSGSARAKFEALKAFSNA